VVEGERKATVGWIKFGVDSYVDPDSSSVSRRETFKLRDMGADETESRDSAMIRRLKSRGKAMSRQHWTDHDGEAPASLRSSSSAAKS
jgi:hypothetical protein